MPIARHERRGEDAVLLFEGRPSDSPFVDRVWRSRSERAGAFLSVAAATCEIVFTRRRGQTTVTLRGPETKPTLADCPADGEWLGIRLAPGAFFPEHPAAALRDRNDVSTPGGARSFWLGGTAWEYPDLENAEGLVDRLVRAGVVARDPIVSAVLDDEGTALSRRSTQRSFLRATGMTLREYRQIQRARGAAILLSEGASIADVVHASGYFDQAHLTRAVTRLIGETPARIRRGERQLSLLYKTSGLP